MAHEAGEHARDRGDVQQRGDVPAPLVPCTAGMTFSTLICCFLCARFIPVSEIPDDSSKAIVN